MSAEELAKLAQNPVANPACKGCSRPRPAEVDRRHFELGEEVEQVFPGEMPRGAAARCGEDQL